MEVQNELLASGFSPWIYDMAPEEVKVPARELHHIEEQFYATGKIAHQLVRGLLQKVASINHINHGKTRLQPC